jgi:hypothetical protein
VAKNPEVRLETAGAELSATARPLQDPDGVGTVVEKFRQKYGADRVRDYYPKTDAAVEVPLA